MSCLRKQNHEDGWGEHRKNPKQRIPSGCRVRNRFATGCRTLLRYGADSILERLWMCQRFVLGSLWVDDNGFESVVLEPTGRGTWMGLHVDPFSRVPSDRSRQRYFQNVEKLGKHPFHLSFPCLEGSNIRSILLMVHCYHRQFFGPIPTIDGTSPLSLILSCRIRAEESRCLPPGFDSTVVSCSRFGLLIRSPMFTQVLLTMGNVSGFFLCSGIVLDGAKENPHIYFTHKPD